MVPNTSLADLSAPGGQVENDVISQNKDKNAVSNISDARFLIVLTPSLPFTRGGSHLGLKFNFIRKQETNVWDVVAVVTVRGID